MSSFTVSLGSLEDMARVLGGLGHQMGALRRLPPHSAAALGGAQVEQAVEGFCGQWGHGIEVLEGNLQQLLANLEQAVLDYETTEGCLARSARL